MSVAKRPVGDEVVPPLTALSVESNKIIDNLVLLAGKIISHTPAAKIELMRFFQIHYGFIYKETRKSVFCAALVKKIIDDSSRIGWREESDLLTVLMNGSFWKSKYMEAEKEMEEVAKELEEEKKVSSRCLWMVKQADHLSDSST
jgi:hypothetical protein